MQEEELTAHQMLDVDELGMDPEGKHLRIISFVGQRKPTKLRYSEHAAFWASVMVTTSPKRAYDPFIVHQGAPGQINDNNRVVGDEVITEEGPQKGYFASITGPTRYKSASSTQTCNFGSPVNVHTMLQ